MLSRRSNVPIGLAVVAMPLLLTGPAGAQSVQEQKLQVQAIIGDICTVTGASLDFGSGYDGTGDVFATGSIDISCVTPTSLGVALDGGLAPTTAAGVGGRKMTQGASELLYVLYTDEVNGDPWATDEVVTADITTSGSIPVYGKIPNQSNGHAPGVHTDQVTITLTF